MVRSPPPAKIMTALIQNRTADPVTIAPAAGRRPSNSVGIRAPVIYSPFLRGSLQVQYGVRYCGIKPKEIAFRPFFAKTAQVMP